MQSPRGASQGRGQGMAREVFLIAQLLPVRPMPGPSDRTMVPNISHLNAHLQT